MDDVIQEITPDQDSQFRLKPCKVCKGVNAKYVHYNAAAGKGCRGAGDAWRVECPDCGHTVDKGRRVRHDAQLAWNQEGESRKQRKGRK